jgi:hypothetical protein
MTDKNIKLTVALPLWRSKDIAWLALEGLCRQKDINFDWELLIWEENYKEVPHTSTSTKPYPFGESQVMKYKDRLKDVGCTRVHYEGIKEVPKSSQNKRGGMHLSNKWVDMAKSSSPNSLCFLLQGGDDYSQPYRLRETYDLFIKHDCDWLQENKGVFYHIRNKDTVLFDISRSKQYAKSTGLNMAIKTDLIRKVPCLNISRRVDSTLFRHLRKIKGGELSRATNDSDHWKEGFFTDGANTISRSRWKMAMSRSGEGKAPWYGYGPDEFWESIPSDIMDRIQAMGREG